MKAKLDVTPNQGKVYNLSSQSSAAPTRFRRSRPGIDIATDRGTGYFRAPQGQIQGVARYRESAKGFVPVHGARWLADQIKSRTQGKTVSSNAALVDRLWRGAGATGSANHDVNQHVPSQPG
jgi:hypothetical protein